MVVEVMERLPVHVDLYHGPTKPDCLKRNIAEVDETLIETKRTFDSFLVEQLHLVFQAGRSEATFLDIGSGEGGLFISFLTDPNEGKESKAFLKDHLGFKLRMVGLTDSPSLETHLREKPVELGEPADEESERLREQVIFSNVHYSLARTQTLEDFLGLQGIETIDLAFATQSLRYLGPRVFEEVIKTTAARLPKGGKFVAWGIAKTVPGFRGALNHDLNVQNIPTDVPTRKWMLSSLAYRNNNKAPGVDAISVDVTEAEKQALAQALETYKRLGVLTDVVIEGTRIALDRETKYFTEKEKFQMLARRLLSMGEFRLANRKSEYIKRIKLGILKDVVGVDLQILGSVESDLLPLGFVITKK